jgi:thiol:disulfide interchange protein
MQASTDRREGASNLWTGLTVVVVLVVSGLMGWLYLRANTGPGAGGVAPTPAMFESAPATLDDALAKAGEKGLVFAFATADWCPPCQHFKRTALVDPAVEAWVRENATPVYIDTDHNQTDAQRLNVSGIPQTTLLRGDGTVLVREVGAMSAEQLLAALRGAVRE